jgi:hypothetical protein
MIPMSARCGSTVKALGIAPITRYLRRGEMRAVERPLSTTEIATHGNTALALRAANRTTAPAIDRREPSACTVKP